MGNIEDLFGVSIDSISIDMLKKFISLEPEENLHLEFKQGDWFASENRNEISKVVSSFANSDGGILIIGVSENKDKGVSRAAKIVGSPMDVRHSKETLENILSSNISPKIGSIRISRLEDNGYSIFILDIPRGGRVPYMASDKRYYKRLNYQTTPMENYEVEDFIFGRRNPPRLSAKLNFFDGIANGEIFTFSARISVKNIGKAMAKHLILTLIVRGASIIGKGIFELIDQGNGQITLQHGPFETSGNPVLLAPSPAEEDVFADFGTVKLVTLVGSIVTFEYQIFHEELPATKGYINLNTTNFDTISNGLSKEIYAPNERFVY